MTIHGFIIFISIYAGFVLSPGPAMAAVIARVLSVGILRTLLFIAGIVTGDLVWFSFVTFGLGAVLESFSWAFIVIKYTGIFYLIYLAYKLWIAPVNLVQVAPVKSEGWKLYFGGLSLCLGNPKAILFFVSILPTIIDVRTINTMQFVLITIVIGMTVTICILSYALMAHKARQLVANPKAMRFLNRSSSTIMAGAAATLAIRS